jgi:hypothetical protein
MEELFYNLHVEGYCMGGRRDWKFLTGQPGATPEIMPIIFLISS